MYYSILGYKPGNALRSLFAGGNVAAIAAALELDTIYLLIDARPGAGDILLQRDERQHPAT